MYNKNNDVITVWQSWRGLSKYTGFTARCYAERGYATECRMSVCPSICL